MSACRIARQASRCQQAFSKPCLVNLISKDTHLVFSIYGKVYLLVPGQVSAFAISTALLLITLSCMANCIEISQCKGDNFNIHIWAWFGYFICSRREIRFYLFGKESESCLSQVNMRAFHENPDCLYYELTFINP